MLALSLLYGLLAATIPVSAKSTPKHTTYSVVTGLFLQDENTTVPSSFDFIASNFGLINRTYPSDPSCPQDQKSTQWQRLAYYISTLNKAAAKNERYSLLFAGRHGEGYHNAAETYFGTPAWNCYWSERDGNGTVTWADAHLTPAGVQQANRVNAFWAHLLKDEKIAAPQSYYTSPLYRCLDTAKLTFEGLKLHGHSKFEPVVKELLREGISAHTCDRRSSKSYIKQNFPKFRFEKGFAEEDLYWMPLKAEPSTDQDIRSKTVLDDIFENDDATYISITSHSGEIASLLRGKSLPDPTCGGLLLMVSVVLGHRSFSLSTGAAIPVLVKVTTVNGDAPPTTTVPWSSQKTCAAPPTIRDSSCNDCSCCT
jgi:broad specificity phosphatase PhoE